MDVEVHVEGLKELEDALADAGPKLARSALKQAVKAAAQPLVDAAKAKAPVAFKGTPQRQPGELRDSIKAVVKLNPRKGKATATIGPEHNKSEGSQSPGVYASFVEFGSIHNPQPQPFMRNAFDSQQQAALERFADVLRDALQELKK